MLETPRHRITGVLTVVRDGYRSRLSDALNATGRDFLPLTEATVEPLDGSAMASFAFLAVHRDHIVLAAPAEPPSSMAEGVDPAA